MNILHCPNCGGDIILNTIYTLRYIKKTIFTEEGLDELSANVSDECISLPNYSLGSAYCDSCGKQWERPFYIIGKDKNDGSFRFIELNRDEMKMSYQRRKEYFMNKSIEIIA